MTSTGILPLGLICVILGTAEGNSFVKIQCSEQSNGQYDHQSLLNCVVQTTDDVKDPEIRAVFWTKEDVEEHILVFDDEATPPLKPSSSRYSFAEPSWNNRNMNVSLLIHKTVAKDEGVYKCKVHTDSGGNEGKATLKVTAQYTKPTFEPYPETLNLDKGGSLTCKSSGYPEAQLRWFDKDNKEWTRSPETKVETTESGLFSLSSTMTVLPGSPFSKYICKVFSAGRKFEAENSYQVKDDPRSGEQTGNGTDASSVATKVVAPVVVIGSLIVGLLLWLLLMYRRRSRREHRAVPPVEFDEDEPQEMEKLNQEKHPDRACKLTGNL